MIIQSLFKLRPLYLKLPGSLRGVLGRQFRAWAGQQKSVVATVEGITFDLAEYIDSQYISVVASSRTPPGPSTDYANQA